MECPMPGYYRDVQNCQKFYYCPSPHFSERPLSSQQEDELVEFLGTGLMCPEGSIYDESIDSCNELRMVKTIPPECQESSKQSPTNSESAHQILTNN
ncbi:unnamed protein product [Orchesella dallaii]|uniref:Chitin-binding type-2 domain-containing protein n=1 Tax=Orchesella dallaii TaxID=48710 RepID=A0ABP1Q5Y4_9HEXA